MNLDIVPHIDIESRQLLRPSFDLISNQGNSKLANASLNFSEILSTSAKASLFPKLLVN